MGNLTQTNRSELEWRVLRFLCVSDASNPAHQEKTLQLLNKDDFGDLIHRALFEEILRGAKRKMSAEEFRRWLPAAMTRRGWPDLDFDDLFRAKGQNASREEFIELVEKLRALANHSDDEGRK